MTDPGRHTQTFIRGIRFTVIILILQFFIPHISFADTDTMTICFYSSESNINNYRSLKINFDNYLSRFGPYEFQPFKDKTTFEQQAGIHKSCLLILSSWHYKNLCKKKPLTPILVGEKNSRTMQKRILVVKNRHENPGIVLQSLSSASSTRHTISIINEIFKNDSLLTGAIKILTVPKDIDALMSVGFGMSKSALVTEASFNRLKQLNPELYDNMAVLAEGEKALLLVLATPKNISDSCKELIQMFKAMPLDPNGQQVIKMLGIDSLQEVKHEDRAELMGINEK